MQEIFSILMKLMQEHSCVIIPNLGGFVMNAKSAAVDYASSCFMPPSKELLFNEHLVHNDGLLAHAMMQERNISFEEATDLIAKAVASVRAALDSKGFFKVGTYGSFVATERGCTFHQAEMRVEDSSSFGLREFYFPLLDNEPVLSEAKSQPKSKRSFPSFMVAGVAALVALCFFSQPVSDGRHVDTANFTPMHLSEVVLPQKSYYLVLDKFTESEAAKGYADSLSGEMDDSLATFEVLRVENEYLLVARAVKSVEEARNLRQSMATVLPDSLMARSFVFGMYR